MKLTIGEKIALLPRQQMNQYFLEHAKTVIEQS